MAKTLRTVLLLMLFLVASALVVSAATTLRSPTASSFHSGTINVTCDTSLTEMTAGAFYYDSAGGNASSLLVSVANTSANQSIFSSATQSVSALSDAATYNWTCSVTNATVSETSAAVGSVTIDNTNPTATATNNGGPLVKKGRSIQVLCDTNDALDTSVDTTGTLTKPDASTVSYTSTPIDVAGSDLQDKGTYTFDCSTTDDSGNTASDSFTFDVTSSDNLVVDSVSVIPSSGSRALAGFGLLMLSLFVGVIGIFILMRKK